MAQYRLPDLSVPVLLSADTPDLLRAEAQALLDYASAHPEVGPEAIGEQLLAVRAPRRCRALARAQSRDGLLDALRAVARGEAHSSVVASEGLGGRRTAFVFPGQGGQRPGMGTFFYENSAAFRAQAQACDETFQSVFGFSPLSYLLGDVDPVEAERTSIVQPALFMQMVSLAAMWRAAGVEPAAVIGHSQGEIAAAYVSGAMTLADAIRVVTIRSRAVEENGPGGYGMALLGMTREACERLLATRQGWGEVSVVNSAHVHAVSGDRDMLDEIVAEAAAQGVFARAIAVLYPAHTSLVRNWREILVGSIAEQLDNPRFLDPCAMFVSSATGELLGSAVEHHEYWYLNLRNPVRLDWAVTKAVELGVDVFVEISEHPMLALSLLETLSTASPKHPPRVLGTSRRGAVDLGDFTQNLAWVAAADDQYQWSALRTAEEAPSALPLPGFPNTQMRRSRLWAHAGAVAQAPASASSPDPVAPARAAMQTQVLVERWEPVAAAATGARSVRVVDLAGAAGPLAAAAREIGGEADSPDVVALLVPEPADASSAEAAALLAGFFQSHRELLATGKDGVRTLLVTCGGEQIAEWDAAADLYHGALAAAWRALSHEQPGRRFGRLDLARGSTPRQGAEAILAAAQLPEESELAARDGALLARRWRPAARSGQNAAAADFDHVLLVGGTGNVGLAFSAHLAERGARRITILNRSGEREPAAGWLARLRERWGVEIAVHACDVTDEPQVRALAEQLSSRPVSLIVHAPVAYLRTSAVEIDEAAAATALAAKPVALEHLLRLWPRAAGCRVLLCSSVSAVVSGSMQALYSASNRMLDILAAQWRQRGVDCVSVQWGLWPMSGSLSVSGGAVDTSDVVRMVERTGLMQMDTDAAITAALAGWEDNVLVLAADWPRFRAWLGKFGWDSLLEGLEESQQQPPGPVAVPATTGPVSVEERVRAELASVMGATEDMPAVDGSTPLVALGLDSLQALELRKRLRASLGADLPLAELLGGASLDEAVALLQEQEQTVSAG